MFRRLLYFVFLIGLVFVTVYLILPSPEFPEPPEGTLQSNEPADTESIYRRSYYSNLSRSEVMEYYQQRFKVGPSGIPIFQLRLNYPPESAQTLIRDQTRSSWLEELVHPGRESLYINGFYPTKPTEQINIKGVHYANKITVRLIPSHPVTRLTVLLISGWLIVGLYKEYGKI